MTSFNTTARRAATRTIFTAAVVAAAIGFQVSSASAYSAAVKRACTGDYLSYCSHTTPGSAATRSCMRKAGPRLSSGCVKALVNAGMVSKSKVSRRSAKR